MSPSEVYCLWLYLKDGVLTLDLVSMSTIYLNFDRRKTSLETVLYTIFVYESQRSLLSMVYLKDGV